MDLAMPLQNLVDAINRQDPAAITECFTTDYACETPLQAAGSFVGNEHVRQNWTQLCADLPDIKAEILRSTADGPEIWSEWVMRGTRHDGSAQVFRGMVLLDIADGLIAHSRFYVLPADS